MILEGESLPKFELNDFSPAENDQIQRLAATSHKVEDDLLKVMVNTVWYTLIPQICWRAVFWYFDFPRHTGATKVVDTIKGVGYYRFNMTDTLQHL